jgi:predicted Rossmann fold nucleotide-binding protein DprA/Smf involved in DNA uptake
MTNVALNGDRLTPDTQATLLLTAPLGKGANSVPPLSPAEYGAIAIALQTEGRRPGDFLVPGADALIAVVLSRLDGKAARAIDAARVRRLLERGGRLALAVSRWNSTGIWVLSRADAAYPSRYKQKLGRAAPSVVYGIGPQSSLEAGGLAVVGSREPDPASENAARETGAWASRAGVQIVSGAARGVDAISMLACAERGGSTVGVVADSLLGLSTRREFREHIIDERLTLISAFDPEAGFRAWMAMMRNRWIYALAERALVVASNDGRGGTWEGAIEALKAGVRVYAITGNPARPGNDSLVLRGAIPAPNDFDALWRDESDTVQHAVEPDVPSPSSPEADVYPVALPVMLTALRVPMTAKQFAALAVLTKSQADAWLARLVSEGRVKKTKTQYHIVEKQTDQLQLLS